MACKELDVNPAPTLDVVGLALESDKRGVVGESSTCNKVQLDFLTLLTTIRKFALLEEMTRSQTIHAENVHFQHKNHLVMWWRFEPTAGIQWMFVHFAEGTHINGTSSEGCHRFVKCRILSYQ